MASDADKKELIAKLTRHVGARFGGTGSDAWRKAFAASDADQSGAIDAVELGALLEAAGVGNFLTIDAWVDGVMDELDRDASDTLTYPELEAVLVRVPPSSPVFAEADAALIRPDYLFPLDMTPAAPSPAAPAPAKNPPKRAAPTSEPPWATLAVLGLLAALLLSGGRRG